MSELRWARLSLWFGRPWVGVGLPLAVALVHIAVVAPRYHVGSFDDDAAYLLMAKGIVHGIGLSGYLPHHVPLLDAYPPGYPLLLAPLLWAFGDGGYLAPRLLSVVCVAALFPLTWTWLRRREVGPLLRVAVLALLAINPLVATYGSMVMAEGPFLVTFLALLLVGPRWRRPVSWAGVATVVLVVWAVWLKEAGLAFVPGVVAWLAWRGLRRPGHSGSRWGWSWGWWAAAAAAAVAAVAGLVPVALGRWATGVPLAGARYTSELGSYYSGGLLHRLALAPWGFAQWCFDALPSALVPTGSPLHGVLPVDVVFRGLACATTVVVVGAGAVVWIRRRGADLAVWLCAAYVAEVCLFKFVNERRAVLILPLLAAWYVLGAVHLYRWVREYLLRRRRPLAIARWRRGAAAWGMLAVAAPLAAQFPTDYLYDLGQSSPAPAGSVYMALLRRVGEPAQVVETTYLWSTALLSAHATDNVAAIHAATTCDPAAVAGDLRTDHASFLLTAAIDTPGQVDSPCLRRVAAAAPWAVPLLDSPDDDASVYELVGPGTAQPDLRALLSVGAARLTPGPHAGRGHALSFTWPLAARSPVTQVSISGVQAGGSGATGRVSLRLREGNHWRTVATAPAGVGTGTSTPFLLSRLPPRTTASAVQLTVAGSGPVEVEDLAVIGPAPASPAARAGHT